MLSKCYTSLLLLVLGSSASCQWISRSHEWEAGLPVRFRPSSRLSLRSSEEEPMKSPLVAHEPEPLIEAQPMTVDRLIMKRKQQRQQPSPVPSADKWWLQTMATRRNDDYSSYYPSVGRVEGPEFLLIRKWNKKNWNKKAERPAAVEESMERVSANPPEFLPSEVTTLQVKPVSRLWKTANKKKVATAVYRPPVSEKAESLTEEWDAGLQPDKMLGSDMMFHRNRLEERTGNDVDDDPNDDFELIQ